MGIFDKASRNCTTSARHPEASPNLIELASESWRFHQIMQRSICSMDPFDAQRLASHYGWYQRIVQNVLEEAGLHVVDLTGERYDAGMAVTPLNLEDFPEGMQSSYYIAQMIEPIVMQDGIVRKPGTAMLGEELEAE